MTATSRRKLMAEQLDVSAWPDMDEAILNGDDSDSEQVAYARRVRKALMGYLRGDTVAVVCQEGDISVSTLYNELHKCLLVAPDGNIFGFRALLSNTVRKPYTRTKRLDLNSERRTGLSGAFQLLLSRYPDIKTGLDNYLEKDRGQVFPKGTRFSVKNAFDELIRLCKKENITQYDYPFCIGDQGRYALSRYVRKFLDRRTTHRAQAYGGPTAVLRAKTGTGHDRVRFNGRPFSTVSIDAKRLDVIGTVGIPTQSFIEYIPIHRMQFLPVIENWSTAILGYFVSIRKEATALDATRAIQHSLTTWIPRKLVLPGMEYPLGAMLPSALPGASGICWSSLVLDNATIHYSYAITRQLTRVLGCSVNWGPVNAWYHNPVSEAVFSALDRRGFHRLPNTTGSGPQDPLRGDAVVRAVELQIVYQEILDLIDLACCEYDMAPRDSLNGRSPLECIKDAVEQRIWIPRRLPVTASVDALDTITTQVIVRGNANRGRRPHINYWRLPYTSPLLADSPNLIGTKLTIRPRESDASKIHAYLPNGKDLGFLSPPGQWGRTPHTKTFQLEVAREHKKGKVASPLHGSDIITDYLRIKQNNALRELAERRKNARPTMSAEATALARGLQDTGEPMPAPTLMPKTEVKLATAVAMPSFVPTIKHKSVIK